MSVSCRATGGLVLLVICLVGCAATRPILTHGQSLERGEVLGFSDIPVPKDFQLLTNESFVFRNDQIRIGMMRYRGRASLHQVLAFYRDHMPLQEWTTIHIIESGSSILNFEKGQENCIVAVTTKGKVIELTVSLAPRNTGAPAAWLQTLPKPPQKPSPSPQPQKSP